LGNDNEQTQIPFGKDNEQTQIPFGNDKRNDKRNGNSSCGRIKETVMERVMKAMQWLATMALVLAGVMLLVKPMTAHAQSAGAGMVAAGPTRFTVVDAGTVGKPDVVLIPGLSSSRAVWDGEAKLLAPNYRLHLVQVDGFAGAPAGANAAGPMLPGIVEELHGYIAASGMKPVVVGHSLGGLLGLMLADKYPADVRKLVVVDALPFYALLFSPEATVESTKPYAAMMRKQMTGMSAEQYAAMQPMMAAQMVKDAAAQKLVAANSAASDRAVVTEALVEDMLTDVRGDLAGIKVPTLVLYEYDSATQQPDPAVYEATMKAAYATMPGVKLIKVEGSKHFIMYDQPGKFDAAVEGFLK
jgi:pimeloyl-ACP methyl ester carboxylesterase